MKVVVGDRNLLPHRELFESGLPSGATVSWHRTFDEPAIAADLADADVYVGGRFTAAMAAAAPKLRLLHVAGAGTDNVAFAALPADTLVANTFHHEDSIAEYIVSAALMLRRGFLRHDRALRGDVWATSVYDDAIAQSRSMRGARVGFVGFGHIGRRSWNVLRAFGAEGCAVTGRGNLDAAAEGLRWAGDNTSLLRLLTESDVVVVSAPLNDHTRGMIGGAELDALGPDGILINVGRGPLVQEQPLYDALASHRIAAAAIDVWYTYPDAGGHGAPSALPFRDLPNILMTPHSSGVTDHTFVGRVGDITDNIRRLDTGQTVLRTVRPA
ncbi:phosphoglycerate dehydrogenase-like enzyme [Rhodococcus wratislaviensis]|uniref:Oxidoreductase n=1 Tax=Rhodococcus wratislaviensis TaxID=44752 RepID=A0AB38FJU7_RHOWR|nr:2-hydroxyacid dehydrogenase [Rhodococcus wratislaviensis]REE74569.1 phosphoglycerate dehydrogenase-like enzyme [Rhodococcus wratislaviensis]SPZ41894.1 oxidoreductase [Rhodococcus wratislaviensis]